MMSEPRYRCMLCHAPMRPSMAQSQAWMCQDGHVFVKPRTDPFDPLMVQASDAYGNTYVFRPWIDPLISAAAKTTSLHRNKSVSGIRLPKQSPAGE